jgi:FkbM family methyltransferase
MSITSAFLTKVNKWLDKDAIKVIYDVGAGDCTESIALAEYFTNAQIYSFEANPACIYDCAKNIVNKPRITFIPICINDHTGLVKFHPINQKKTITSWADGNPKASSIFVSNGTYPHETYVQDEIEIPCMRLIDVQETFKIPNPDIIWMDLQGAELSALKSLGRNLSDVKIIHTEIWGQETYTGQSLFPEMKEYMDLLGFSCEHEQLPENWIWSDAEFIRKDIYNQV